MSSLRDGLHWVRCKLHLQEAADPGRHVPASAIAGRLAL
jgi:hypothetical protein